MHKTDINVKSPYIQHSSQLNLFTLFGQNDMDHSSLTTLKM